MPSERVLVKARLVWPSQAAPLDDGVVTVRKGVVAGIGAAAAERPTHDLGNVALLPPLVNAHTHFEFSDLQRPLAAGATFANWLRAVLEQRAGRKPEIDTIAAGLRETECGGVSYVGEIATSAEISAAFSRTCVGGTRFLELIGSTPTRMQTCLQRAIEYVRRTHQLPGHWQIGLSPHAPYTTSLELVQATVALARQANVPVAMHLAETEEELELLRDHSGPLRDLLDERNVWNAEAFPRGTRPLDYLRLLAEAPQALIVHGNYLEHDELAFLATRDNLSLVYCPRTHAFFHHQPYPLRRALDLGIRVRLGTDSRASNPDLSLWDELKFAAQAHPDVTTSELLQMATSAVGDAWGGTGLEIGAPAVFTRVELANHDDLLAASVVSRYVPEVDSD